MREVVEQRLYKLGILLAYLLVYGFVITNPNIDKLNYVRVVIGLGILISLYFIWELSKVLRIKSLVTAIKVLAFLGIVISSFMLYAHYNSASILCPSTDGGVPCDIVNKSIYAEVLRIPVAAFGILGYLAVFCFGFLLSNRQVYSRRSHLVQKYEQRLEGLLSLLILLAFVFTIWLNYVQFIILKTLCIGCELSAITIVMLLIVSIMIWRRKS